ncbi:MAG: response regulator, partial [Bacteroidales bacterium]|nr:response regulator [Bacteroidales bacterium]
MEKFKILFVGDDIGLIEPLHSDSRFDVQIQSNGVKALRWLEENRQQQFDGIICNMFMKGVNGIAFFEEMKHQKFLQTNTPFILISRGFRESLRKVAYSTGLDDYYSAPIDSDRIFNRISYLLDFKQIYSKRHDKVRKEDLERYRTPL